MNPLPADVHELLHAVTRGGSAVSYQKVARQLPFHADSLRPVRIALLASYTINALEPYLQVEAAHNGFAANTYVGPFNAIQQELLDAESGCSSHNCDVIFIAQLLEDVCPRLVHDFLGLSEEQVENCIEETVAELVDCLQTFRRRSQAAVVVHNFALRAYPALGIYEAAAPHAQSDGIRRLNRCLAEALKSIPGAHVLDFDRMCAELGYRNWHDKKMWYLGRAPLAAETLPALARLQAAFVQALVGQPRKCLVLDLDHTLWGGVIGEDGVSGIKLGHNYPGNAYRDIQRAVLQLHRRGVLLAINSKNNPGDVDEVFDAHPDMILQAKHFASTAVNWRSKAENLTAIADELNIGLESLVFLDDNPAECALVRQALPQVLTWQASDARGRPDPLRSLRLLQETTVFDRLSYTREDRQRSAMYRQQVARRRCQQAATSVDEFLSGLEMTIKISPVDDFLFPRVLDLIHKTNQFNLTTRRHSEARLSELLSDPDWALFAVQLADRFGDNGTVGVAILHAQESRAVIDTFLLSCRVIGRNVETAVLSYLAVWAANRGAVEIEGEFMTTPKNAPAADCFARHGFSQITQDGTTSRWRLPVSDVPFVWPAYIRLENGSR